MNQKALVFVIMALFVFVIGYVIYSEMQRTSMTQEQLLQQQINQLQANQNKGTGSSNPLGGLGSLLGLLL